LSRLESALRTTLLDDPASIETLPPSIALRLDRLFEGNRLEPLLFRRAKDLKTLDALSIERLTAWKTAGVLSVGRSLAFAESLREIMTTAAEHKVPVKLLKGTQVAFFVYPEPSLRPLVDREIQTPPEMAPRLQFALKTRRFLEVESPWSPTGQDGIHLPTLAREGVTVKIHRRSAQRIPAAPWDTFTDSARHLLRPRLLSSEPLLLLLGHDLALRNFCHSLLELHDIHLLLGRGRLDWNRFLGLARETNLVLETWLSLSLAQAVLGSPVDAAALQELGELAAVSPARKESLLALARASVLQYPASWKLSVYLGKVLEACRVSSGVTLGV
jgi:hypothetical protein